MIMTRKEHIRNLSKAFLLLLAYYVFVTILVQAMACPELSHTELFLRVPKSILLDFKMC